jgi:hypothetical protein
MKQMLFWVIPLMVFLSGCPEPLPEQVYFKNIDSAPIASECTEFKEDVCGLYACLAENCWCEQSPDKILMQGNTVVSTEEEAINAIKKFLLPVSSPYEVKQAKKLNSVFFNVFVEALDGEKVFTVAADETIIKTQCGI